MLLDWTSSDTKTVGVFGKLPTHPDFIRLNAGGPGARAWDEWIGAGLEAVRRFWVNGWEGVFDQSPAFCFVVRPTADPATGLAGYSRAGHDQSGRRYPFSIFAEFQLDKSGRGSGALPLAFAPFFTKAARALNEDSQKASDPAFLNGLLEYLPAKPLEMARPMAEHLSGISMEQFWSGVLGSFDNTHKYLIIKNLFGSLAPMRGYNPDRLGMGLRLPGARPGSGLSPASVMAIWASLCRAVVGDATMSRAGMFWHDDPKATLPVCLLFFHMPGPSMFPALIVPSLAREQIWDLATMGQERVNEAADALGPAITSVLDSPRYVLLEFIQRI